MIKLDLRIDEASGIHLEPASRPWSGGGKVVDLGHVDDSGTIVVTTNSLVGAGPVAWLLVHFHCESIASLGGTITSRGDTTVHITSDVLQVGP
jgi:hypothetical protein